MSVAWELGGLGAFYTHLSGGALPLRTNLFGRHMIFVDSDVCGADTGKDNSPLVWGKEFLSNCQLLVY